MPVVGNGGCAVEKLSGQSGGVVEAVGVGDQADFDVFLVCGGVYGEGGGFEPVEYGLGLVGWFVLEDEVAADDRRVINQLNVFEGDLGHVGLIPVGDRPGDEAFFPRVQGGPGGGYFDCDPHGLC